MPAFAKIDIGRRGVAFPLDGNGRAIPAFGMDEESISSDTFSAGAGPATVDFTGLNPGGLYEVSVVLTTDTHLDFEINLPNVSGSFGDGFRIKAFRAIVFPVKLLDYQDQVRVTQPTGQTLAATANVQIRRIL